MSIHMYPSCLCFVRPTRFNSIKHDDAQVLESWRDYIRFSFCHFSQTKQRKSITITMRLDDVDQPSFYECVGLLAHNKLKASTLILGFLRRLGLSFVLCLHLFLVFFARVATYQQSWCILNVTPTPASTRTPNEFAPRICAGLDRWIHACSMCVLCRLEAGYLIVHTLISDIFWWWYLFDVLHVSSQESFSLRKDSLLRPRKVISPRADRRMCSSQTFVVMVGVTALFLGVRFDGIGRKHCVTDCGCLTSDVGKRDHLYLIPPAWFYFAPRAAGPPVKITSRRAARSGRCDPTADGADTWSCQRKAAHHEPWPRYWAGYARRTCCLFCSTI